MANGHGGVRTPANPAPVSGPSAMSKRTDGGPAQAAKAMTGGSYGDSQDMMSLQRSAPMAAAGAPQTQGQRATPQQGAMPTPFSAPTERPNEPVTEGNPLGPGAGAGVLSNQTPPAQSSKEAQAFKKYLPALMPIANSPDAPPSFVKFVKYLRDV